jgi:hypothetical protein
MALCCRFSSEGQQKRILTIGTSVPPKKIKKTISDEIVSLRHPVLIYNGGCGGSFVAH